MGPLFSQPVKIMMSFLSCNTERRTEVLMFLNKRCTFQKQKNVGHRDEDFFFLFTFLIKKRLESSGRWLTRTLFSVLSPLISSLTLLLSDSFTFLPTASLTLSTQSREEIRWSRGETLYTFKERGVENLNATTLFRGLFPRVLRLLFNTLFNQLSSYWILLKKIEIGKMYLLLIYRKPQVSVLDDISLIDVVVPVLSHLDRSEAKHLFTVQRLLIKRKE